jgi:translation initiation factor 1
MPFTIGGEWIPETNQSEKNKIVKPKHPVKVIKEKKGKSIVTVILNLPLDQEKLKKLCSILKQRLACGGTIKESAIELQGDKIEQVKELLQTLKEQF